MGDAKKEDKGQAMLTGYVSTVPVPPKIPDSSIRSQAARFFFDSIYASEDSDADKEVAWKQELETRQAAEKDVEGRAATAFLEGMGEAIREERGDAMLWDEELNRRQKAAEKGSPNDQIKVIFLHLNGELLERESEDAGEQLDALVKFVVKAIETEKPDFISLREAGASQPEFLAKLQTALLAKLQTALKDSDFAVQEAGSVEKCIVLYNKNLHKPLAAAHNFKSTGEDPVFFFQREKEGYDPVFVNMVSMSRDDLQILGVEDFFTCATSDRTELSGSDDLGDSVFATKLGDTVGILSGRLPFKGTGRCFYASSRQEGSVEGVKVESRELEGLLSKRADDKRQPSAQSSEPQPFSQDPSAPEGLAKEEPKLPPEEYRESKSPATPPKPWLTVLGVSFLALAAGGAVVKGSLNLIGGKEVSKFLAHVSKDFSIGMVGGGGVLLLAILFIATRFAYTKREEVFAALGLSSPSPRQ